MGEVIVQIGGTTYRVGCGDGEEARLEQLAEAVNREAEALAERIGNLNETRLMLMSALMLADKWLDAEEAAKGAAKTAAKPADTDEEAIAAKIDAITERVEALGARIARS